jgi:hypothetical protein
MGPKSGLEGCGKSRTPPGFDFHIYAYLIYIYLYIYYQPRGLVVRVSDY